MELIFVGNKIPTHCINLSCKRRQFLALAHTWGANTSVCTKEDVAYTVNIRKMYLLKFLTPIIIIFSKGVYSISPYMYMQT